MSTNKTDIWVYLHQKGMSVPKNIGILSAHRAKGRKAFSFEYDKDWIQSQEQILLDPDIGWYSGLQFPSDKENFGIFLDSMPDRWGRTLMKRRAAILAKENDEPIPKLYDIDFLLGVQDESRMGALRFKLNPESSFLTKDTTSPIPPISTLRELQYAAQMVESDEDIAIKKWLSILMAPGSSLGGARPKANVYDENGQLWIAKFPAKNDETDKGAWEFVAYQLAINAGLEMSKSVIQKVSGPYHTFLTQRFDRDKKERIHFASAMTMTGNNEDTIRDQPASYLELAEFIQYTGAKVVEDLHQLWRRIVFNIAISNTDDHLRNHGFLLQQNGWRLSPAYDLNPSTEKDGLSLNIDMDSNELDIDLAKSVGTYFQLNNQQMDNIIIEVTSAVNNWRTIASEINISRQQQERMARAFKF